jgi:hypothetical protein
MSRKYILYALMFAAAVTFATIASVTQLKAKPKVYRLCGPHNCSTDKDCTGGPCPTCDSGVCVAVN